MKKIWLMLALFIVINSTAFSKDDNQTNKQKELLILDKAVILYESETGNSKKIRVLDFLEKVYLVKESTNNKILVLTEKNEKGWVNSVNTSLIPPGWKKIDSSEELSIYIPKNLKFSINKGKWGKHRLGKKFIESKEDKIYSEDNFYILIYRSSDTFEEKIEKKQKQKKSDDALNKKNIYIEKFFKENNLTFYNGDGMDFTQFYSIILQYKENSYISVCVTPQSSDPSPEEIRTALKILFSFEIK